MRHFCIGFLVILIFSSLSFGDGCYIPEKVIRKIPEIPAQRAVLSWKDGTETLVISSALDSESQKLGWIIPVPKVPQKIEKVSPGSLKTLDFCIQPRIYHDYYLELKGAIIAFFVANLLLGVFLFCRRAFLKLLTIICLLMIFLSLLLPALGTRAATTNRADKIRIETSAVVGSYNITVLSAEKSEDLNAWLSENGFAALPASANPIIADYILKGWVFAAVQLTRAVSGVNVPHPIQMTFPSDSPIYPLRLTAVAGGNPEFEIFVIAADKVSSNLLTEEFCDRFQKENIEEEDSGTGSYYLGMETRREIGHPAICRLMWQDCVLTKFSGTIPVEKMTADLQFPRKSYHPTQQWFFTMHGAREFAELCFLCLTGTWIFVSMPLFWKKILMPRGKKWYFLKGLLPALGASALLSGIIFSILPKLDDSEIKISRWRWSSRYFPFLVRLRIEDFMKDHPQILQGTDQEITERLLKSFREDSSGEEGGITNLLQGTDLRGEDSPGNFTVEKQAEQVVIHVYDRTGRDLLSKYPLTPEKHAK